MNEQLARRFGNIEVVFKEALYRHKRLAVKKLKASLLEDLLEEHLAKRCGKLIYQSSDTEIVVTDNILFGLKNSSDFDGDLRFLVCSCEILDVVHYRGDTDGYLGEELCAERIGDLDRDLFDLAHLGIGLDLLDENDVTLANADYIIARLVREHILKHFKWHHIGFSVELDKQHYAIFLGIEMQFLGLDINIARQDIVKDDIFDKRTLVVLWTATQTAFW